MVLLPINEGGFGYVCYFSVRNLTSAVALAMLVMVGCSDERRDHPVFLDDLNDVDRFPSDDRRQLKAEHESLPSSMVVRVPVDEKVSYVRVLRRKSGTLTKILLKSSSVVSGWPPCGARADALIVLV